MSPFSTGVFHILLLRILAERWLIHGFIHIIHQNEPKKRWFCSPQGRNNCFVYFVKSTWEWRKWGFVIDFLVVKQLLLLSDYFAVAGAASLMRHVHLAAFAARRQAMCTSRRSPLGRGWRRIPAKKENLLQASLLRFSFFRRHMACSLRAFNGSGSGDPLP